MDQFKTRILNTNQLSLYSGKPLLIFYVKVDELVVFQIFKSLDNVEVQLELSFPIGESLVDSIDQCIQKVLKHSSYNRRSKIMMMMDDYYLTMHRCNLN